MRRIAVLLVFIFLIAINNASSVAAESNPSWAGGAPTVLKNSPAVGGVGDNCSGYSQDRRIFELNVTARVCLFGDDRMGFGYFSTGGPYRAAVQLPLSNELHVLENACNGMVCQYSADTDILVTLQQVEQFSWGVAVYANASRRVERTLATDGSTRYVFDRTSPEYEIKNDLGRYVATPSFAISNNGKWIVVELRNKGIAVVNTEDFSARQISTNGYQYGYGMDPSEQLAVSNDGKSVAVMGQNAGFVVIEVTPGCGQELIGDLSPRPLSLSCGQTNLGITGLFPNFHSAEHPRFIGSGRQLEVIVNSWVQGSRRVTFLAHGATPTPGLKLLALGDSFISGEGETDDGWYQAGTYEGVDRCHVSKRSYPLLVAGPIGIGPADAKTVACSGAQVRDIIGSVSGYWGQGDRLGGAGLRLSVAAKTIAQDEAVTNFQPGRALQSAFLERYDPANIMIGVGGNDAGLMGKLRTCVMPGTCEWAGVDGTKATAGEIRRLFDTLGTLFSRIKSTNSDAKVYVAGYPNIIEVDGTCDPVTGLLLNRTERLFIQRSVAYINQVIRAAAKKAEFTYLDIEHSLNGRMLCSGNATLAMNGLRTGDDISISSALPMLKIIGAETFHPTPTGHRMIADTILADYPNLRPDPTCASDPVACSVVTPSIEPPAEWLVSNEVDRLSYATDFAVVAQDNPHRMNVNLPEGLLEPGSEVQIEIRSSATNLGAFRATEAGAVNESIIIPTETEPGFHTLHLLATNREGRAVDMYQFVTIGDVEEGSIGRNNTALIDTGLFQNEDLGTKHLAAQGIVHETVGVADVLGATSTAMHVPTKSAGNATVSPRSRELICGDRCKRAGLIAIVIAGSMIACTIVAILVYRRWAKHVT